MSLRPWYSLQQCTCRSDVRHESKYMASREARKLPASVRTVTSSSCSTDGCNKFWAALGYAVDHELIMDGCSFLIYQEGHQVRVSSGLSTKSRRQHPCQVSPAMLSCRWLCMSSSA